MNNFILDHMVKEYLYYKVSCSLLVFIDILVKYTKSTTLNLSGYLISLAFSKKVNWDM